MRPDSDIDLLLIVDRLTHGRMARMREFEGIEDSVSELLQSAGIVNKDCVSERYHVARIL